VADEPEKKPGGRQVDQRPDEVTGVEGVGAVCLRERGCGPVLPEGDQDPGQRTDDDRGDQGSDVSHNAHRTVSGKCGHPLDGRDVDQCMRPT